MFSHLDYGSDITFFFYQVGSQIRTGVCHRSTTPTIIVYTFKLYPFFKYKANNPFINVFPQLIPFFLHTWAYLIRHNFNFRFAFYIAVTNITPTFVYIQLHNLWLSRRPVSKVGRIRRWHACLRQSSCQAKDCWRAPSGLASLFATANIGKGPWMNR